MIKNRFYWDVNDENVCVSCGNLIDFSREVGISAIRETYTLKEISTQKIELRAVSFCSECGTNIELLHSLGFKRIIGTLTE